MAMDEKQLAQVQKQRAAHQHKGYVIDIPLTDGSVLKDFIVDKHILRPEIMTSVVLARYLFFNNGLYHNKAVIDMGCGSGIQSIVMGLYGAQRCVATDIYDKAVQNTAKNVLRFGLGKVVMSTIGDLFETVPHERFDTIVFNHPFFHKSGGPYDALDTATVNDGGLLHSFLEDAPNYMATDGTIVMPYYHLAGPSNDPGIQAAQHNGYIVSERFRHEVATGLQTGLVSIYELTHSG